MDMNLGSIERVFRIGLGLCLVALIFVGPKTWWGLVGVVPLLTGYLGFCPLYGLLGFSSCPPSHRPKVRPLEKRA